MRPFSIYPDSFDGNVLGYWRFGERGGLLTDIVAGKVLTNVGAVAQDDGYRFVRTDPDYMSVAFAGQDARSVLTMECWARDLGATAETYKTFMRFVGPSSVGGANGMELDVWHGSAVVRLRAITIIDGAVNAAIWDGGASILASSAPFHIAAVRNGASLRLFVNGVLVHSVTPAATNWPAGTWTLNVGMHLVGFYYLQGVLDEVRLSKVARYAANFPIARFQDGRRLGLRGPEIMATAGGIS